MTDEENALGEINSEEDLIAKHKRERKVLQAEITKIKHSVPKGDKKKKKESSAKIALLEAELNEKQEKELADFKLKDVGKKFNTVSLNNDEDFAMSVTSGDQTKKISKAQKRRDRKAAADKERDERIKKQEIENLTGARFIEQRNIMQILAKRSLSLYEIPSDGNCLYAAVEDQLKREAGKNITVEELRSRTAEHMRKNKDDFLPFLCKPESGNLLTPEEYLKYCDDLENTPAWGGQPEIRALSNLLEHPIEVIQGDGPSIITGEEFKCNTLILTYHRHVLGLGEHYNSVQPKIIEDEEIFS